MNGTSALTKETTQSSLAPSAMRRFKQTSETGRGPASNHADTLSSLFQLPKLCGKNGHACLVSDLTGKDPSHRDSADILEWSTRYLERLGNFVNVFVIIIYQL